MTLHLRGTYIKFFVTDFLTKTFSELLSFVHNVSLVFWAHRGDGETKHQQRQQHICWCRWSSYDTGECPLVQNISHLWNKYSSHIFIIQKSFPFLQQQILLLLDLWRSFMSFPTVSVALNLIRSDALQTFRVGPTSLRLEPLYIKVLLQLKSLFPLLWNYPW